MGATEEHRAGEAAAHDGRASGHRGESRTRLLEAMAGLLWERGYAATSPRDVMRAAGVGQGSMYHYFPGKRDLALEALRGSVARRVKESEALEGPGDPLDRIERYLLLPRPGVRGCRIGRMTQDPDVVKDTDMLSLIDDAFRSIAERWSRALREAIDSGEFPADLDPDRLARTMSAVIQGGFVLARASHSQEPMDQAVQGMVDLLESLRTRHGAADEEPRSRPNMQAAGGMTCDTETARKGRSS